jgi:PilZ domain
MSELAKRQERQRQRHPRHATLCPGTLISGDEEVDCEVLNISVGGAKIRVAHPIQTATNVCVKILRVGEFTGRVAWCNGTTMGVEFQDELTEFARIIEEVLRDESTKEEQREDARASVLWSGKLRSSGQITNCRIVNFSLRGVQLLTEKEVNCGLEVILWIERFGEFTTKLIWQDGPSIGVQFNDPPKTIASRFGDSLPILR